MSMPLGVIAFSAATTPKSKVPKPPKTPKPEKQPKKARESGDSTEKSSPRRLPHLFGSRSSAESGKQDAVCGPPAVLSSTPAQSSTSLARQESVPRPQRAKHIPILIPDYHLDLSSFDQSRTPESTPFNCVRTPELINSKEESIASTPSLEVPHFPIRPFTPQTKKQPRHVQIVVPYSPQSLLSEPSPFVRPLFSSHTDPCITAPMDMSRSAASSRTSTLDSTVSAPSPNQLYSRKGSSAQLSVNSSRSSLNGRDDYTSEHDSLHSGHTPSYHQGRSNGASPAISSTPGHQHLSGLVCNVHRTTGKEPPPLVGATTTILGDKLYVFGGRRISRSRPHLTSDLYELDLLRRHWTRLETKGDIPAPRYFHSICALGDNKLVCYGGMSPEPTSGQPGFSQSEPQESQVTVMSDVHIYDTPTRTWMRVGTSEAPQGRYAHCAAILPSSAVFASANAPVSAIHHNPSGTNPNAGFLGVQIDGTGGAEMIVVGGQDSGNHYIEQISVFNLRSLTWTSTLPMSGKSCGAYRSVVTPLTTMSAARIGAGPGRPDEDEDDGDDDADEDVDTSASGSPMLIYTNYNFLDVRLELQVRLPDGSIADKPMQGSVSPPGLRFPSGGIIDNNFVVAGTFLTSSKQEFSLWSLDLRTLAWARIDTGSNVFSQGSWNRGVLWNRRNAFVILGNRKRNLVDDYNNRRLNFSNICLVQLEAFGLYDNPRKTAPTSDFISGSAPTPLYPSLSTNTTEVATGGRQLSSAAEQLGEMSLTARELSDMDFLALDGTRLSVNSRLVARRWGPSFNALLREGASNVDSGTDTATLRATGVSLLSRNSSITITPSLSSTATTLTANTASTSSSSDPADARGFPPNTRPRTLYLPHTVPTLQALIHYLYTSSLPPLTSPLSTPQIFCSLLQLSRPYAIDGLLEAVIERLHETLDSRNAAAIFNAAAMGAGGGKNISFAATSDPNNNNGSGGTVSNGAGSVHPPRTVSLAGIEGLNLNGSGSRGTGAGAGRGGGGGMGVLRIDTDVANGGNNARSGTRNTFRGDGAVFDESVEEDDLHRQHNNHHYQQQQNADDDDVDIPNSASTTNSLGSQLSIASSYLGGNGFGGHGVRREDREVWDGGWSAVIGLQKRGLRGLMEGRRARERGGGMGGGNNGSLGGGVGGIGGRGDVMTSVPTGETKIGLGIA